VKLSQTSASTKRRYSQENHIKTSKSAVSIPIKANRTQMETISEKAVASKHVLSDVVPFIRMGKGKNVRWICFE
jgi:hypothetical protein